MHLHVYPLHVAVQSVHFWMQCQQATLHSMQENKSFKYVFDLKVFQ